MTTQEPTEQVSRAEELDEEHRIHQERRLGKKDSQEETVPSDSEE